MNPQEYYNGRASRQGAYGTGPYRSRNGIIFGACRGLAEHFGLSVTGTRLLVIVLAVFTGIWPMVAGYLLAALLMRVEPILPLSSDTDAEFYNSYAASRTMALRRLKSTYDHLESRIQRLENLVTSRKYDWEQRLYERE
ncbi:MAG: DNA-binding transcriptional activator PspC [Candidatus Hydrogenedentes bacterium ADurb.Bin101]|jgi:phage shock protein C|nr:MAG: DNA-binding transcriptional activator PspC [Candidatus Hydrogenedentes bacterium ADurb.Bin101]HOC70572.1 PspC domain-containing protein [Candidatus Hydrogenedentota bacterium]